LEAFRKATEKNNKPDPELGKVLAALSEKSGIKSFLDSFDGKFGQPKQKRGTCKYVYIAYNESNLFIYHRLLLITIVY